MLALSTALVVLSVALAITTRKWRKGVGRRRAEGYGRPWRIRRVPLHDVDPIFTLDPMLGHGLDTEVAFTGRSGDLLGATTNYEAWVLAALARHACTMFEFGTCTGRTTYLWARNAPDDARVYTLTLPPGRIDQYQASTADSAQDAHEALTQSMSDRYMYAGTAVAHKVTQLYGDSKGFDETPYVGQCDLIFVDGSHAYSYAVNDSAKALRMVKPGGLVIWHDYFGGAGAFGVYRALNELADRLPLVHIARTTLVAYRAFG
jgi:predicted O-methyltransferase YrrM